MAWSSAVAALVKGFPYLSESHEPPFHQVGVEALHWSQHHGTSLMSVTVLLPTSDNDAVPPVPLPPQSLPGAPSLALP